MPLSNRSKAGFSGVLAEAISCPEGSPLATILTSKTGAPNAENTLSMFRAAANQIEAQAAGISSKWGALFKHYDLESAGNFNASDPWHQLARSLAIDFVPGFQLQKKAGKRGRKLTSGGLPFQAALVLAVRKKRKKSTKLQSYSERWACARLVEETGGPWRKALVGSAETLHKRYMEAKKSPLIAVVLWVESKCPDNPEVTKLVEDALLDMAKQPD